MVAKKDNSVSVEALKELIASNPDLIRNAIEKMGIKPKGEQAYTIIGKEQKEIPLFKMENTKLVPNGTKKTTCYLVRTLNGNILSIPEHCLKDYKIDVEHGGFIVDEDGLTVGEINNAITNGAF